MGSPAIPASAAPTPISPIRGDNEVYGGSLRIDQDLGFARLASISGYRHVVGDFHLDQDATPTPIVKAFINQFAESFSQEVQLLSPKDSKIDWLVGGYFFTAKFAYTPLRIAGFRRGAVHCRSICSARRIPNPIRPMARRRCRCSRDTKLTLGLRYTPRIRTPRAASSGTASLILPDLPQKQSFRQADLARGDRSAVHDDILGYLSYNRGIKSGGFNMINAGTPGYRPEILDAYEAGLKMQLFDRRVRFNVAAFIYDYKDIQVFNITGGGAVLTTNAAAARVHGHRCRPGGEGLALPHVLGRVRLARQQIYRLPRRDLHPVLAAAWPADGGRRDRQRHDLCAQDQRQFLGRLSYPAELRRIQHERRSSPIATRCSSRRPTGCQIPAYCGGQRDARLDLARQALWRRRSGRGTCSTRIITSTVPSRRWAISSSWRRRAPSASRSASRRVDRPGGVQISMIGGAPPPVERADRGH